MSHSVEVFAKNKSDALSKGMTLFAEQGNHEINQDDLQVKLLEEKKGFLNFRHKKKFKITLNTSKFQEDKNKDKTDLKSNEINIEIDIDGEILFKISPDGVFLKIIPPEGKGDSITHQEIKDFLGSKNIIDVDWSLIEQELSEPTHDWFFVAPRKTELDQDSKIEVSLSDDKLRAYISYFPALGGKEMSLDEIYEELKINEVAFGLKRDRIKKIIETKEKVENVLIAEGKEPVLGKDAEIIYCFESRNKEVGLEKEDGTIDFHERNLISNVKKGDMLAVKKELTPGKPGKTVTFKDIPPPEPNDIELPQGNNVIKKDNTLIAAIDGQVVLEKGKIHVLEVFEIDGDVDLNTGNVDFVGNIIIKGSVKEGFSVKARGNIEIKGNVSFSVIESGGSVIIHKGFIGYEGRKEKGIIIAKKNIQAQFIENATVKAGGDVIVQTGVMHSNIEAGGKVEVKEKKGLLVGGFCRAGKNINVNIVGSTLATPTILESGINPRLKQELEKAEKDLEKYESQLDKSAKGLKYLKKLKEEEGQSLSQSKEIQYHKLIKANRQLLDIIEKQKEKVEKIKDKQIVSMTQGQIRVNKKVYSGVTIKIGRYALEIHDEMSRKMFIEEDGEIKQISL